MLECSVLCRREAAQAPVSVCVSAFPSSFVYFLCSPTLSWLQITWFILLDTCHFEKPPLVKLFLDSVSNHIHFPLQVGCLAFQNHIHSIMDSILLSEGRILSRPLFTSELIFQQKQTPCYSVRGMGFPRALCLWSPCWFPVSWVKCWANWLLTFRYVSQCRRCI